MAADRARGSINLKNFATIRLPAALIIHIFRLIPAA